MRYFTIPHDDALHVGLTHASIVEERIGDGVSSRQQAVGCKRNEGAFVAHSLVQRVRIFEECRRREVAEFHIPGPMIAKIREVAPRPPLGREQRMERLYSDGQPNGMVKAGRATLSGGWRSTATLTLRTATAQPADSLVVRSWHPSLKNCPQAR